MSSIVKTATLGVAAALAGAVSLAALTSPAQAADAKQDKCYGVAKKGENGCASQGSNHSCAGQSTVDYDGMSWKLVPAGTCADLGGKTMPFKGTGMPKPM